MIGFEKLAHPVGEALLGRDIASDPDEKPPHLGLAQEFAIEGNAFDPFVLLQFDARQGHDKCQDHSASEQYEEQPVQSFRPSRPTLPCCPSWPRLSRRAQALPRA